MTLRTMRRFIRAGRNVELTWRYLFNFAPTMTYQIQRPRIEGEAARLLEDLNRDGIAVTNAEALFGKDSCFDGLCKAFDHLLESLSPALEQARARAIASEAIGEKSFIFEYLGDQPLLKPQQVYARFALHQNILQIANAYLGMHTRLRYYNIWHTFRTQAPARESQLWHVDREDHYILKVFAYLQDVEEGTGPFTYAPGTHAKGHIKATPQYRVEGGVQRSTDEQMAAIVPAEEWVHGVGRRGTIIFADTHGYHKGGLARNDDRIMYTCMFTSPASESREFFRRDEPIPYPADRAIAFALAEPHGGAWLNWRPSGFR